MGKSDLKTAKIVDTTKQYSFYVTILKNNKMNQLRKDLKFSIGKKRDLHLIQLTFHIHWEILECILHCNPAQTKHTVQSYVPQ